MMEYVLGAVGLLIAVLYLALQKQICNLREDTRLMTGMMLDHLKDHVRPHSG
jgi:hypothetical protein